MTEENYKAPEMLKIKDDKGYDFKVDFWPIGIMIYKLWKKKLPFEKDDDRTVEDKIK